MNFAYEKKERHGVLLVNQFYSFIYLGWPPQPEDVYSKDISDVCFLHVVQEVVIFNSACERTSARRSR